MQRDKKERHTPPKKIDSSKKNLEFVQEEEEILDFWEKNDIFQKSLNKRQGATPFVFYEGPPTANGRPGIHHVLARSFKDLVCRYKTMRGFLVERKAGWDTHGLPVELEVEKELKFKNKSDIKNYGIEKFNEKAKASVWHYKKEWEELTKRMGFWIDMKHPYVTFSPDYIESVWWLLKQAAKKNLIAETYRVLPYCPRCGTPLSSHEVALGYKNVRDPSLYLKFEVLHPRSPILRQFTDGSRNKRLKVYLLVWTTTPWTLPANVAVAVHPDLEYKIWQVGDEILISFTSPPSKEGAAIKKVGEIKGKDLVGEEYQPLYRYLPFQGKNIYKVVPADFISLEEGTGLVHIAPAFGEDDYKLKEKLNLPFIQNVGENGCFLEDPSGLEGIKGKFFKDADPLIFTDLEKRGLLYKGDLKGTVHDYPFCWRCGTPLLYYAQKAWVIKMSTLRKELLKNNSKINWIPSHIKNGRFGQWLREVRDWTISRRRYWGTPLPIWKCPQCGHYEVIGSLEELREKAVDPSLVPPRNKKGEIDLHRPYIDKIKIKCPRCGAEMSRVEEVLDCWFDSGSMPYAQWHWPFAQTTDRELPVQDLIKMIPFPADFICEAVDQTRGWFYTLLAISTILGVGPAYKNVISLGLILDKNGEKMSKSKGNIISPSEVIKKYGVDSLRWYFYTMNAPGEEKRFSEKDLVTSQRRFLNTIWNILLFYKTYAFKKEGRYSSLSLLDKWILAQLEETKEKVTSFLDKYSIQMAGRTLGDFVDNLSRWYLRRSRRIFQKREDEEQWKTSSLVLRNVLRELSLLLAPFCPFFSEMSWREVRKEKDSSSVHLMDWPILNKEYQNKKILGEMDEIREIAAQALKLRQEHKVKVRQPLSQLKIKKEDIKTAGRKQELLALLKAEVNVKKVVFSPNLSTEVELDFKLTPALKAEGIIRELVRRIQEERKKQKLIPQDKINIILKVSNSGLQPILEQAKDVIKKETGAKELTIQLSPGEIAEGVDINGERVKLAIERV